MRKIEQLKFKAECSDIECNDMAAYTDQTKMNDITIDVLLCDKHKEVWIKNETGNK